MSKKSFKPVKNAKSISSKCLREANRDVTTESSVLFQKKNNNKNKNKKSPYFFMKILNGNVESNLLQPSLVFIIL